MLVVCCVFSHTDDNDHVGHRGDMARVLTRWQHLVASHEANAALHWAMLIALYRPGGMVIQIAIKLVTIGSIIDESAARNQIYSSLIFTI
jgi:hypothetical protein